MKIIVPMLLGEGIACQGECAQAAKMCPPTLHFSTWLSRGETVVRGLKGWSEPFH